jgi:hypothetical protein
MIGGSLDRKGKAMNLKGVAALLLFFFATAFNALAVDFLCFASDGDCKENGPFLNVEWITVVRNLGSGQIEVWFDGWLAYPPCASCKYTRIPFDSWVMQSTPSRDTSRNR